MNVQHSSRSDEWYTPVTILERVHKVLAYIDFDPASSYAANTRVQAKEFLTREEDGLNAEWSGRTIFCNPPGGKIGNQSKTALFWDKLMRYREKSEEFDHAIFLAFSLEALQVTQHRSNLAIAQFPFCVPSERIRFDLPDGSTPTAPSHSNMIVYVPGKLNNTDLFYEVFSPLGCVLNTRRHP